MSTANKKSNASDSNNNQSFGYRGTLSKMSAHKPVDIMPVSGKDWILNGNNNENFKRYISAYNDSPTNAGIINAFVSYIYGDGIVDLNGQNIESIIDEEDVLLMIKDLKIHGGFAYQIVWSEAEIPLKIKYIEIAKLGIRYDTLTNEVNGYWYCFDWKKRTTYKPLLYPVFDGNYKDNGLEIGYFRLPTAEPFFPLPDYFSGLQWAEVEGEQANAGINHFKNSMSDITVINYNGGRMADPVAAKAEADKRREQIVGTDNQSAVIVSFNDGAEEATVVDRVSPPELNQQNVFYAEEAEKKIVVAHSVPPILFSGTNQGTGFSSNADEREISIKDLYRRHINPYRKCLLKAFNMAFLLIDRNIKLDFANFEEEKLDNVGNPEKI